jgi:N-methylhydantoinase A
LEKYMCLNYLGRVKLNSDYFIEKSEKYAGFPILSPVVDIVEIGTGGGSIAWKDEYGKLRVGPKSAGAVPGPVAYGRGGSEPTTTDANIVMGCINSENIRGDFNLEKVESAITRVGDEGVDVRKTAQSIVRIANHNMVKALKLVSVNRGHDPREFSLVAFGGGKFPLLPPLALVPCPPLALLLFSSYSSFWPSSTNHFSLLFWIHLHF